MPKTPRNAPCPCGSGKKYKHCCLPKDEDAAREAFAQTKARMAEAKREHTLSLRAAREWIEADLDEAAELAHASNAVVDLIHAGRLDEAERAARDLLVRYPDVHDGYDRLGMVYEARGQSKEAADCYRLCLEFVVNHPDQYDPDVADTFRELVATLDSIESPHDPQ